MTNETNDATTTDRTATRVATMLKRSEAEVARLEVVITHLVDAIVIDAETLQKTVREGRVGQVYTSWIDMHVRSLAEAREQIDQQRELQRTLKQLVGE
jgi:hypothetical protein